MGTSNMKNIVVLKNLPSNLVDEAIVILKANKNAKKLEYIESSTKLNYSEGTGEKDYIVKEAETVISDYISTLENNKNRLTKRPLIERKYKKIKIYSIVVSVILVFMFIKIFFA